MEGETLKVSNLSLELGGSEYRTCLLSNDPNPLSFKIVRFSNANQKMDSPSLQNQPNGHHLVLLFLMNWSGI